MHISTIKLNIPVTIKILILYLVSIIVNSVFAAENNLNDNDWHNFYMCGQQLNKLCQGYYIQPSYPLAITKNYPPDTIIIKAEKTKLVAKGLSKVDGNVIMAKNNQQLMADHAVIQQNSNGEVESFTAKGNIRLTTPGLRFIGDSAEVVPPKDYKVIYNSHYRIYDRHARGSADKIEILQDSIMKLPNATYTTCKPGNNWWQLGAKKVKFNKTTGRGEAWHAKMYIKNIPVFYLPYINFPIDSRRKTGFLQPNLGRDSKNGIYMQLPWYWNVASNYDYSLSPMYMSKRGLKLDNQFRYLGYKLTGILQFNFLPHDKAYKIFVREKLANPGGIMTNDLRYRNLQAKDQRYYIWFSNQIKFSAKWDLTINYNKVSDSNYLQDFGQDIGQGNFYNLGTSGEEVLQSSLLHLEQSLKLKNVNSFGLFKLNILQYQTLYPFDGLESKEQYKKMPELSWNSYYIYLPNNFKIRYDLSYVNFRLHSIDGIEQNTTGKRLHLRPSLEHPIYNSYGHIKPRMQLDFLSYQDLKLSQAATLSNKPKNPTRVIPIFDLHSGLNFVRNIGNSWQQTLEPHIYYLYIPKIDQNRYPIFDSASIDFSYNQLFRDNRYSGIDRLSDANQVTLGIKTGLFSANGEEKAAFGIARAKYFHKLTPYLNNEKIDFGKWSPIAMLLNYKLTPALLLEADLVQERINKVRSSTFTGQYKLDDQRIINMGYQYTRFKEVPEHQWYLSGVWNIKEHINLLGKFDYDLSQKRTVYSLAGVELHGCCTIVRIAWARSLINTDNFLKKSYNNKFLAQVVFKGFGGVGDLGKNYISSKIPGYKSKENF